MILCSPNSMRNRSRKQKKIIWPCLALIRIFLRCVVFLPSCFVFRILLCRLALGTPIFSSLPHFTRLCQSAGGPALYGSTRTKMEPVPIPLHTIRAAFTELGRSVGIALRTQMGDAARLGVQRQDCIRLLALTEQVRHR